MILVFGIMYFFLIRPQQKKLKEHEAMLNALRRGDQVVTQGGIIAKVTKVKDDGEVELEIAQGVKVRVVRSSIATVMSKTEPAKSAKPAKPAKAEKAGKPAKADKSAKAEKADADQTDTGKD